jgi:uncharacterized damage-inducible protein DinB
MNAIRVLCAVGLALPLASVAAQPPALSEQSPATAITVSFRSLSALFAARLIGAFDSIPTGRYAYAPTPAQQTVGYVAQHLVDANYALCSRFGRLERPIGAGDALADTVRARWPKDTLVERLKASFRFCASAMSRVDDAKLAEEVPVGPPGAVQTQQRALSLLLYVTDLAEHYSQIASYMRLIGLVPPSALRARQRTAIDLPAAVLARYVGVYEVAPSPLFGSPSLVLEVTLSNGALSVKPAGQPAARLWPETETNFFVKEVDVQITFTVDATGALTGLVVHQYGENRPGNRHR